MHRKGFKLKQLLQELKKGNLAAIEYLFKQHHKAACRYVYERIHDLDHTDTIYFQVIHQVLLQINSFNTIEGVRRFLFDALAEACVKFLQDQDGEITDGLRCVNSNTELLSSEDLECKKLKAEVWQEINDIIHDFPPSHYQVCKFYYFERKRNRDVADDLNLTRQEVYRLRIFCAKKLKEIFDKQDACRQYYWLFFLSDRFIIDAGIDTE